MASRLITYDLSKEKDKKDYDGFYSVIKSYDYIQLSESSYAVATTETPQVIYQKLEPFVDDNDRVAVIVLVRPYWGKHTKAVWDWLDKNL